MNRFKRMINGYQTEFSVKRQSVSVRFPFHGHIFSIKNKLNLSLTFFPGNPGRRGAGSFVLEIQTGGGSCPSENPGERGEG